MASKTDSPPPPIPTKDGTSQENLHYDLDEQKSSSRPPSPGQSASNPSKRTAPPRSSSLTGSPPESQEADLIAQEALAKALKESTTAASDTSSVTTSSSKKKWFGGFVRGTKSEDGYATGAGRTHVSILMDSVVPEETNSSSASSDSPSEVERLTVLNALKRAISGHSMNSMNEDQSEIASNVSHDKSSIATTASSMYSDLKRRITLGRNWKLTHSGNNSKSSNRTKTGLSVSIKGGDSESDLVESSSPPKSDAFLGTFTPPSQNTILGDSPYFESLEAVPTSPDELSPTLPEISTIPKGRSVTLGRSVSANTTQGVQVVTSQPAPDVAVGQGLPSTAMISPEKRKKYVEVRKYILGELLSTEKNYVTNLEIVLNQFKAPLLKAAQGDREKLGSTTSGVGNSTMFTSVNDIGSTGLHRHDSVHGHHSKHTAIIPMVDIKLIFGGIDDLWEFNKEFAKELEVVVQNWEESEHIWELQKEENYEKKDGDPEPKSIGELFISHIKHFSVYLKFVDNYSAAKEAVRRSEENSASYRQFILDCLKSKECQKQGISDFLILPVQRVTRYVLLLQDLKKHTPNDHPDYANIVAALDEMRQLANTVNEVKRREEEMTRMFHVVRSVEDCPPTIISAQRRILFEVDSNDVTKDYSHLALSPVTISGISVVPTMPALNLAAETSVSIVRIFLFTDLIMFAKPKSKKKKEKSISKYMNSISLGSGHDSSSKKEKLALFRLSWLKDIECVDIEEDLLSPRSNGSGSSRNTANMKNLVKLILYNSDGQSASTRKRFWTELAMANNAAVSSTLSRGKRSSVSSMKSTNENLKRSDSVASSPANLSTPASSMPVEKKDLPIDAKVSESGDITVEEIEKLAMERIRASESSESSKATVKRNLSGDPAAISRSPAVKKVQRASTIASRSPTPRNASLTTGNPNLASLLEQMTFDTAITSQDKGVITKMPSSIPTKPLPDVPSQNNSQSTKSFLDIKEQDESKNSPLISMDSLAMYTDIDSLDQAAKTAMTDVSAETGNVNEGTLKESASKTSLESMNSATTKNQTQGLAKSSSSSFSKTLSPTGQEQTATSATTVTETFIIEFTEKKQKNEFLLILEKVLRANTEKILDDIKE